MCIKTAYCAEIDASSHRYPTHLSHVISQGNGCSGLVSKLDHGFHCGLLCKADAGCCVVLLSKVADMLKLRVQTGNSLVIAGESILEVLSMDGRRAKLRIRSSNFCSVIFYSAAAQNQKTISFDGDEQILSLPEGSSVHMNGCTVMLKSVGANALVCEFNAPRSVNIEKRK